MSYKYCPSDFKLSDRLFHGFGLTEVNPVTEEIDVHSIRFPDFSCNWERFSKPEDVKKRIVTDGCYAFTVEVARFKSIATACHDPIPNNYSHIEVRLLYPGESVLDEPPKDRKPKKNKESKAQRFEYRMNIIYNLEVLIQPTA